MPTRVIETPEDLKLAIRLMEVQKLPFTVEIRKGKHRSTDQNRLQRLWINEAVEQLGDETAEEKRAYCKLHLGVPILRNENEMFKTAYDEVIRPLPYELKLKAMMVPLDFPVTRVMTTKQHKQYLDAIYQHFSELGVKLTDPEEARNAA